MKKLVVFLLFLVAGLTAGAQNIRWDSQSLTIDPQLRNGYYAVLAVPNATISFYTGCTTLPCSTLATTYASANGSACPTSAQIVWQLQSGCQSTSDAQGNFGGWFSTSGNYQYTITVTTNGVTNTYGPYPFSINNS